MEAPPESIAESGQIELSVVMPCLNEEQTVGTCIRKALESIARAGIRGEVIIADNGSTDRSREVATELGARVVAVAQKGYGSALKGGIAAARGTYIIMGDADDSYDFTNLMPFVEKLREGYDLVMGNRFRGGVEPGAMPPLHRYLGNPVLSAIGRLFFSTPSRDFHCGLRGFRKDAAERMKLKTSGMEFASEMVIKASLNGMRVTEVPTTLARDGRDRPPHLRSWRDGWRHLRFMLLFSPRWLFLYPGLLLMLMGLVSGLALMPGPVQLAGVVLDVNTLVYAGVLVVIGFNAVLFAVLTRIYALRVGLIPGEPAFMRLFQYFTLETGLIAGLVLLAMGIAGAIGSVVYWNAHDFGPLTPSTSLRLVVPSAIAIMVGVQIILSSFFLSMLGMEHE